jgi:hypothetical protein
MRSWRSVIGTSTWPNTFTRKVSRNIGASLTSVGSYTVGGGVQTTVIGLSVCNTTTSPVTVDVTVNDGTNDTYLVKGAGVGVGNALIPIGGDEKVVLITGDSVRVKSSAATSLDVVMSILEIS